MLARATAQQDFCLGNQGKGMKCVICKGGQTRPGRLALSGMKMPPLTGGDGC